jgi:hypothetical protein
MSPAARTVRSRARRIPRQGSQRAARDKVKHKVVTDAVFASDGRFIGSGQYFDDLNYVRPVPLRLLTAAGEFDLQSPKQGLFE